MCKLGHKVQTGKNNSQGFSMIQICICIVFKKHIEQRSNICKLTQIIMATNV